MLEGKPIGPNKKKNKIKIKKPHDLENQIVS
jgi:hypothetical protein